VTVLIVVIAVVVVVVVAWLITRSRRTDDGVEGFRRQIDALSSDARRPTIDRGLGEEESEEADGSGGTDAQGDADDGA